MAIITKEQLEQASVDAKLLNKFRKGTADETIPTDEGLKPTIAGIVKQALESASIDTLDGYSFKTGATIYYNNQALLNESDDIYYRWSGSVPAEGLLIPANSSPSVLGIGPGKWLSVGDSDIRSKLKSEDGANFVNWGLSDLTASLKKSVKYFGATGNGNTDDTMAFQNAYDSTEEGGVILINPGTYNISAITGTKFVKWEGYNSKPSSGALFNLPGVVTVSYENSTLTNVASPGSKDTAPFRLRKDANYTGGESGYVNATGMIDVIVRAGGKSYEWGFLAKIDSYRTYADQSEDCSSYIQATKNSTGKVFGQVVELIDKTSDPVISSVTQELDVRATGQDSNDNRVALHIVATSVDGNQASAGTGIKFTPDAKCPIDKLIYAEGVQYNYLIKSNNLVIDSAGTITTYRGSTADSQYGAINFGIDSVKQISLRAIGASTFGLVLSNTLRWVWEAGAFRPQGDASQNLGSTSFRFNTIYATGSVTSSDINYKESIEELSEKERAVALSLKSLIKKFKYKDMPNRGIQIGLIAQEVESAFKAQGLSAEDYSLFDKSEKDDGSIVLGLDYSQLSIFILSSI